MGAKMEEMLDGAPRIERLEEVTSKEAEIDVTLATVLQEDGRIRVRRDTVDKMSWPRNPEELRLRHSILGITWLLCRDRVHGSRWLYDLEMDTYGRLSNFVLGKHCAGLSFGAVS